MKHVSIKSTLFFTLFSFTFIFRNDTLAAKSENFINSLSEKIFEDCSKSSIEMRGVYPNTHFILNTKDEIKQAITFLSDWPFRSYIEINGQTISKGIQPQPEGILKDGSKIELENNGKNIIYCENGVLDINGDNFIWDGKVFETPSIEINQNVNKITGNVSQVVNTGNNNSVTIKNTIGTSKGIIDTIVTTIIGGILTFFLRKIFLNNKNTMFKGTIVENSLGDKSILKKIKVERTYGSGDWILHDVWIEKELIPEVSKYLIERWYAHFWEPGKDDVVVVFKDKIFNIKYSNKSTWAEAIEYGKSIGIPEAQLDFPID